MARWFCAMGALACLIAAGAPAQAQTLKLNDYSYDTVCDFTNRYFIKLKRRIEPKEWDAIRAGKGKPITVRTTPEEAAVNMLVYSHRGLRVRYSMEDKQRPRIWQVDLDRTRVSQSLRTKDEFMALFKVSAVAVTEPTTILECDGATLQATFDGTKVRKLSLVMSAEGI